MNRSLPLLVLLLSPAPLLSAGPAQAWASANRFGGSSFHGWGASGHTNTWGGSTEHVAGEGTEHTNAWGGSTGHAYGGGTDHTNMYGGSTYGAYGAGVGHTYPSGVSVYGGYPAYHPPVAGGSYAMLPPGAIEVSRFGVQYYLSGNTWYQPLYGANGVFYRVVPAP